MVADTRPNASLPWRCFHCDAVFHTVDDATDHFGPAIWSDPACAIDAHRLRELEAELARYRNEDTDLHREIHGMQAKHQTGLMRAEEQGYARGLRDGANLPADSPERAALTRGVRAVQPWEVKVHCSKGERTLRAGMQWRDGLTGSTWEVVEPGGSRIYSPSGFGGTGTFWCKPIQPTPQAAKQWLADAREDGCVSFCGDSIAAGLISTAGVEGRKP